MRARARVRMWERTVFGDWKGRVDGRVEFGKGGLVEMWGRGEGVVTMGGGCEL